MTSTSQASGGAIQRRETAFIAFLLLFYALIAPSPVWPAVGIRGFVLLIPLCLTLAVQLLTSRRRPAPFVVLGLVLLLASALIPAFFWSVPRLAAYPAFFVTAALLTVRSNAGERRMFVDLASRFLLVVLIGAVIGYAFSALGFGPIGAFENTDGRTNYIFYTTFSNTFEEKFIRPSGIYDEPGALSFFVCMTAYLREATGRSRRMTYTLLLLGLITFSIMHVIFIICYVLASQTSLRNALKALLYTLLFVAALV